MAHEDGIGFRDSDDGLGFAADFCLEGGHAFRLEAKIPAMERGAALFSVAIPDLGLDIVLEKDTAGDIGDIGGGEEEIADDAIEGVLGGDGGELLGEGVRLPAGDGDGEG